MTNLDDTRSLAQGFYDVAVKIGIEAVKQELDIFKFQYIAAMTQGDYIACERLLRQQAHESKDNALLSFMLDVWRDGIESGMLMSQHGETRVDTRTHSDKAQEYQQRKFVGLLDTET